MFQRLRHLFFLYRTLYKDGRTPNKFRWLLWFAAAYVLFPMDIIPDAIPLLGQLDDIGAIVTLLTLALRVVPEWLRREAGRQR